MDEQKVQMALDEAEASVSQEERGAWTAVTTAVNKLGDVAMSALALIKGREKDAEPDGDEDGGKAEGDHKEPDGDEPEGDEDEDDEEQDEGDEDDDESEGMSKGTCPRCGHHDTASEFHLSKGYVPSSEMEIVVDPEVFVPVMMPLYDDVEELRKGQAQSTLASFEALRGVNDVLVQIKKSLDQLLEGQDVLVKGTAPRFPREAATTDTDRLASRVSGEALGDRLADESLTKGAAPEVVVLTPEQESRALQLNLLTSGQFALYRQGRMPATFMQDVARRLTEQK